jgi:UBX domain-containing protein 1
MANRMTFDELRRRSEDADKEITDEERDQQKYVGGADGHGGGSGLMVVDPPNGGGPGDRRGVLDEVMSRAAAQADDSAAPGRESEAHYKITMYANGFQVNDGPLRDLEAPENKDFLEDLLKGQVPKELEGKAKELRKEGRQLNIGLSDKRSERYVPPPEPAYVAFSKGTVLGGSVSAAGGGADAASVFTAEELEDTIAPPFLDEQPSTTILIKTSAGTRLKLKINLSVTVLQLAAIVREQQGAAAPAAFTLSAGFPPSLLGEKNTTAEAAGLKGAAITQKSV